MRTKLIGFGVVGICVCAAVTFLRAAEPQAASAPQKWEYLTVSMDPLNTKTLNSLGDEGWELVLIGPHDHRDVVLKRPKPVGPS